jgi:hypothetical protein
MIIESTVIIKSHSSSSIGQIGTIFLTRISNSDWMFLIHRLVCHQELVSATPQVINLLVPALLPWSRCGACFYTFDRRVQVVLGALGSCRA